MGRTGGRHRTLTPTPSSPRPSSNDNAGDRRKPRGGSQPRYQLTVMDSNPAAAACYHRDQQQQRHNSSCRLLESDDGAAAISDNKSDMSVTVTRRSRHHHGLQRQQTFSIVATTASNDNNNLTHSPSITAAAASVSRPVSAGFSIGERGVSAAAANIGQKRPLSGPPAALKSPSASEVVGHGMETADYRRHSHAHCHNNRSATTPTMGRKSYGSGSRAATAAATSPPRSRRLF